MKLAGAALVVAALVQLSSTARVLAFAAMFRWLPAEMRDGHAAWLSIEAAIAAEAEMIA